MNSHYTYFLILALSLIGPLALSFDRKVAFYKNSKYIFPAMVIPAVFYIAWDCWFTSTGVWSFNPDYIKGWLIYNLPLEEVLFFFIVPYCCMFIYECIRIYFPRLSASSMGWNIFPLLGLLILAAAFIFRERNYTLYSFVFLAVTLLLLFLQRRRFPFINPLLILISYAVILIPFLLVNGFLTALPVVIYNDAENTGLRIYTIPFEDIFYGMLLFILNVLIFEKLRKKAVSNPV